MTFCVLLIGAARYWWRKSTRILSRWAGPLPVINGVITLSVNFPLGSGVVSPYLLQLLMGPTLKSCNFAERHLGPSFCWCFCSWPTNGVVGVSKIPGGTGSNEGDVTYDTWVYIVHICKKILSCGSPNAIDAIAIFAETLKKSYCIAACCYWFGSIIVYRLCIKYRDECSIRARNHPVLNYIRQYCRNCRSICDYEFIILIILIIATLSTCASQGRRAHPGRVGGDVWRCLVSKCDKLSR